MRGVTLSSKNVMDNSGEYNENVATFRTDSTDRSPRVRTMECIEFKLQMLPVEYFDIFLN